MNINWKVRLKSGPFWMGIASAVIMAVFLYFKPLRRCAGDHGQPDRGCGKAGFDDSGRDRDHL